MNAWALAAAFCSTGPDLGDALFLNRHHYGWILVKDISRDDFAGVREAIEAHVRTLDGENDDLALYL